MNEFQMAAAWRERRGYVGKGGVVVVFEDGVCGWVNELRNPESWRPGCIAVDESGNEWVASGGNDYDGATEWRQIGKTEAAQ